MDGPGGGGPVEGGEDGGEQLARVGTVGGAAEPAPVPGADPPAGPAPPVRPVVRVGGVGEQHGGVGREAGAVAAPGDDGVGGAGGLGAVLGGVGKPEEPVGGADGPDRVPGGGDAAGHALALGQGEGPGAQLFGDGHHLVGLLPLHQQAELVAAEPGGEAAGEFGGGQRELVGEPFQQPVPHLVAELVVDPLQPVDVADDQGDHGVVPVVRLQRALQPGVDRAPVGEAGERVGEGEPAQVGEALGLGESGRDLGGEQGRVVGVGLGELGHPDRPGEVQLAPGLPVQHDRRDHAAGPTAPAQRGGAFLAVRAGGRVCVAGVRFAVLGGLQPGARQPPGGPALFQVRDDLGEVGDGVGLVLGQFLLTGGEFAVVDQDPQPAGFAVPDGDGGHGGAERLGGAGGGGPDGFQRGERTGHVVGQLDHGLQSQVGQRVAVPRAAAVAAAVRHDRLTAHRLASLPVLGPARPPSAGRTRPVACTKTMAVSLGYAPFARKELRQTVRLSTVRHPQAAGSARPGPVPAPAPHRPRTDPLRTRRAATPPSAAG